MATELTRSEIAVANALCGAASPGPWTCPDGCLFVATMGDDLDDAEISCVDSLSPEADAAFVAGARTVLPKALATIDARDAEIGRLRGLLLRAHPVLQDRMMWAPEGATLGDDAEVARLVSEIDAELAREVATSDA